MPFLLSYNSEAHGIAHIVLIDSEPEKNRHLKPSRQTNIMFSKLFLKCLLNY